MNPSIDWRSSLLLALPVVLTACGPTSPADGTGATDGATGTSPTTEGTSSTTEQADSSGSTGSEVEFACPDARWYAGNLEIDDRSDLEAIRNVGGLTGSLVVAGTSTITDLEFLSCLEVVEGTVSILDNDTLANLGGLERLRVINGNTDGVGPKVWDLGIFRNAMLPRIDSIDSLETLGILFIGSNESLTEVEMPALRQVGTLSL